MKSTGKPAFVLLIAFVALYIPGTDAFAQSSVNVSASVLEKTIFTGEQISFSIKISGDFNNISRPEMPEFQGFRLLSNNPSTSRSYSFINGRTSSSYTYTYYLIARNKGDFEIPAVSVQIDGQEYKTEPIAVTIIDRNASATRPSAPSHPDIFLQLDVSDESPVPGQQLIADIVLYFKDGLEVNSYQPVPGWKAQGFWKEELENTERPRAESVIINGLRYRKARLLQFALFPTKAGELTISPYEVVVSVRSAASRSDPFSSFFGGFGTNRRQIQLRTDPVTIHVQPLPQITGTSFMGGVGSFDITRRVNTQRAVVGESVEIETIIKGTGNIPLIGKPAYNLPDGLEVYEPQENVSLNRRNGQINGTKTFTDIVIARTPGTFTIPEMELAYFDPERNRYITETLPALTLSVKRNPDAVFFSEQQVSFSVQPVTGLAVWITPVSPDLLTRWWFWAGLIAPALILSVGYWQKVHREKMNTDTVFARSRKAAGMAANRLETVVQLSEQGNIKEAYHALQKVLTGFIGDRLNLPEAGLSVQEYVSALDKKGIDPDLVRNVRMLLDKCATISYAPDTSHEYLKSHVGLAQSILDKLKKVL